MKTKFFLFFFFLFFVSLVSLVSSSAPTVIGNITNQSLGSNGVVNLLMSNYYQGYTTIDLIYFKPSCFLFGCTSEIYVFLNGSQQCLTQDFTLCLIPSDTDINLQLSSTSEDSLVKIQISAWNGSMFTGYHSQNFYVNTSSTILGSFCTGGDFIQQYACTLSTAFPVYTSISTAQKFSMVFIVMIIVTFMLYLLFYLFAHSINSFMNWIVFLVDIILFFYFASIQYIPVVLVVILGLVLILLVVFRVKGGS